MIKIKHITGAVLFESDAKNIANVVAFAIASGADLSGANLCGEDLGNAYLCAADLSDANLYATNLSDASLRRSNLSGANLCAADLSRADLYGANLCGANLSYANLHGADLRYANLHGADLRSANLSRADLSGANLCDANLCGASLRRADVGGCTGITPSTFGVPVDDTLPARVAAAALGDKNTLDMGDWHTCDTTHCLAGWAIHLAGAAGYALEAATSPTVAGAMLMPGGAYLFYADNDTARKWLSEQLRLAGK